MKISRREWMAASAAGVVAAARQAGVTAAVQAGAPSPVSFAVPANACDCHAHVFGDPKAFPFFEGRAYTPPPAPVESLNAMRTALRTRRIVLVQPSVYGTDHRCLLDALKRIGTAARGVAVVDDKTTDATLDQFDRAGVRAVRLNLETGGTPEMDVIRKRLRDGIDRAVSMNWHVQLYTRLTVIEQMQDIIVTAPVQIVIDHFGRAQGADGRYQPGFYTLLELVKAGHLYVKISAPYLGSTRAPDYADMAPLAQALIQANPSRILWGSDWPHVNASPVAGRAATDLWPFFPIDDGLVLSQLATWAPDAGVRKSILTDNPATLFGFA